MTNIEIDLYDGIFFIIITLIYTVIIIKQNKLENMSILVCSKCGGTNIQVKAWVDTNTSIYISEADFDEGDRWCIDCQSNDIHFISPEEFKSSKEREEDKWNPAP